MRKIPIVLLIAAGVAVSGPACAARCTVVRLATLPVTMSGERALVHARINDHDVVFVADSGAFYSTLTPAAAAEFKLRLRDVPANTGLEPNYEVLRGVGGLARTWLTTVKTFTIFDEPIRNVDFLVTPNDLGGEAVGLLGQNVLGIADVEYDLANGTIRFIRPESCGHEVLAYWAHADQPYSVLDLEATSRQARFARSVAYVNGSRISVLFDTGAPVSALTLAAARRAGVTPETAGVLAGGTMHGIGRRTVASWIAPFASFKIGDEEIRNTKLRMADLDFEADMLVGMDFFLSHHVYVANSQRKLYFTYNGGPVFNLKSAPASTVSASAAAAEQPSDAAGFARRGAAFTARHDYQRAIADLDRACELAPGEAGYLYQRGLARLGNKQPDLALADFDAAIRLKPEDVQARLARAELRLNRADSAAAVMDLDAVDHALAAESAVRLRLGSLYERAGQLPSALAQYSKWIEVHDAQDTAMSGVLNARCWDRALLGQELEQALSDCDAALRLTPANAAVLDSRGLVHLRRNELDKAIADYNASLRLRPKAPWSLYGRGIARLRRGASEPGHADLEAASAIDPKIAEEAASYGIRP